jgi:adenylate kinase
MTVNIVVGLSGVGKGTVLEEAMLLSENDYEIINYGDKMLEIAKERDLVEHRDEMKNIEVDTYKEIQREAAEQIFEESEDKDVIVDTHAAIKSPYGYIPGLPKWTIENLQPDKIIILDASAEEIISRRESDSDRDRVKESVESMEEYREVAREMAATGSVLTGAYLKTIKNKAGKAEEAAEELIETLEA